MYTKVKQDGGPRGYVAPGARNIARTVAPPPASDVTKTAPGSVFMSYGPGLPREEDFAWNSLPSFELENVQPEASWDIRGNQPIVDTVQVQGGQTPPSVTKAQDEVIAELGLGATEIFWLAAAGVLYYFSQGGTVPEFAEFTES